MTSNVWYSENTSTSNAPGRFEERVEPADTDAAILWCSLEALNPSTIKPPDTIGADGITVHAYYRQGSSNVVFEMWGADPSQRAGAFAHLLYDLAWKTLKNPLSVERLEQLHGYLRDTLPARVIDGPVRRLRLFGALTSSHDKELRRLFASLSSTESLVVDMTNFEGMGTLLYPLFVKAAQEHPRLAWVCSPAAKRHIQSMGLIAPQVFETVDAAVASLGHSCRP
jgi:hypothetical protein